jgi:predicted DNA-binding transcriptional regulator AlpA
MERVHRDNTGSDWHAKPEKAPIYWMHEAICYLGLDRLGLAKPEQAIYRMVRKGILQPRKIGRFLAFSKAELDHIVANGEKKRTKGRPRKNPE